MALYTVLLSNLIFGLIILIDVSDAGFWGWLQFVVLLSRRAIVPCFNGLIILLCSNGLGA